MKLCIVVEVRCNTPGASNSVVECQLPKLKVAGSNPVSRSLRHGKVRLSVHLVRLFGWIGILLSLTACRPDMLDQALRGKLSPTKSNEVITEYCQSCHIHRAFDPNQHIPRVGALYDRQPYTTSVECRVCHLVFENTWGMKRRKTLWPSQVAQDKG